MNRYLTARTPAHTCTLMWQLYLRHSSWLCGTMLAFVMILSWPRLSVATCVHSPSLDGARLRYSG